MDEEIMEVTAAEDTTPEATETESTAEDEAAVETTAETEAEEQPEGTTPTETQAEEEAQEPDTFVLPVKFRHETRDLSTEEATRYAQLGMLRESEQEMMDQLAMMASARGQSPAEFVAAWSRAEERHLLESKLQITGGNEEEAQKLLKYDLEQRRAACNARAAQEQEQEAAAERSLTDRLAAEFAELREEYPEVTDYGTIPQEVVNDAVKNGRHLLDAYLRYERREGKKIEKNRAAQAAAAKASTGSMADHPPSGDMDEAAAALVRGVESAF